MVPLFAKTGIALLALKWRLALAAPWAIADQNGQLLALSQLTAVQQAELENVISAHPERLGSLSVGKPSRGALVNGIRPTDEKLFRLMAADAAFGTEETVDYLKIVAKRVQAVHPGAGPLVIGHISGPAGGRLKPHLSHQSGRDVDVGYFYKDKPTWYRRANAANFDVVRTWTLVRSLIAETDVEMIFIDHSLQKLLFDHAESIGEDPDWLASVFRGRGDTLPLIRHARGHATHLHVRFFNPKAQKLGQDLYPLLVKHEIVPHVDSFQVYRAKKGDTLEKLSRTFGVSVRDLKRANGLKSSLLIAKQTYRIPRAHGVEASHAPIIVPPRRVPPKLTQRKGTVLATEKSSGLGPTVEESHDVGEPEDD